MCHAGLDRITKKPVQIAKALLDRKLQRAKMQFFKAVAADRHHAVANPAKREHRSGQPKSTGYRPGRKTQQRRQGKK